MKIAIAGTGYVGLVSGACLAELGHHVICIDRDAKRIADIHQGIMPIYEPGLEEMVRRNAKAGRLSFETGFRRFDDDLEAVFIAVGTPPSVADHSADLSAVFTVAEEIARNAVRPLAIVTKSTVPVGTGDQIERLVARVRPEIRFDVVSNPEFLREGSAISDFLHPDRIVFGSDNDAAHRVGAELYHRLTDEGAAMVHTARRSAEMIKYASNAFLATKIAFVNEMADLCEVTGAGIGDVSAGMGLDKRIGREFLQCGPGFGGSCFPKDTEALLATAHTHGINLRLVESTIAANEARKRSNCRKIISALDGDLSGKTVSVLGLTFKANTDDMRQAPALSLVASLLSGGATVNVYDPEGMTHARKMLERVTFCDDSYACATGADAVVILTDWGQFTEIDFRQMAQVMTGDVLVDLRNCIPRHKAEEAGLRLFRIGEGADGNVALAKNPKPKTVNPKKSRFPIVNTGGHAISRMADGHLA